MLHAVAALRRPCGIHGRISAADHDYVLSKVYFSLFCVKIFQECQGIQGFAAFQLQFAPLVSAHCQDYAVVFLLQFCYGWRLCIGQNLHAQLPKQGYVLVDYAVVNPEIRDDGADYTAQLAALLIDRHVRACLCQVICRRHTGGAAAYDRCLLAAASCRRYASDHSVKCFLRAFQLGIPDLNRRLIEVPVAVALAAVSTDGSCDERQCVLVQDHLQCLFVFSFSRKPYIGRDLLVDRTCVLAWSRVAVQKRYSLFGLPGHRKLRRFYMVGILNRLFRQPVQRIHVNAFERLHAHGVQSLCHLFQSLVSARL